MAPQGVSLALGIIGCWLCSPQKYRYSFCAKTDQRGLASVIAKHVRARPPSQRIVLTPISTSRSHPHLNVTTLTMQVPFLCK